MSFNDEFFEEFQRFFELNENKYADIEDAIEDFVEIYNEKMLNDEGFFEEMLENMSPETESLMLVEETVNNAQNEEEFIAGMQEALDIWPENLEAKLALIHATADNMVTRISQSEQLLAEETVKWKNETDQMGWLAIEERSFLTLKHTVAMDYFDNNMYKLAETHFKEELEINENDNLGARYYLAAIYANLFQWDQLMELYNRFEYSESEVFFVLPLLVSAILKGENVLASNLFQTLVSINDHVGKLLEEETFPVEDILEVNSLGEYRVNSYEELCLACGYLLPLIASSNYVFEWMEMKYFGNDNNLSVDIQPALTKDISSHNKKAEIIAPDFLHLNDEVPDSIRKVQELYKYTKQDIFKGIHIDKVRIFVNQGLKTREDFAKKTEKQVLAIYQIGPATVDKLKENGVVFKNK